MNSEGRGALFFPLLAVLSLRRGSRSARSTSPAALSRSSTSSADVCLSLPGRGEASSPSSRVAIGSSSPPDERDRELEEDDGSRLMRRELRSVRVEGDDVMASVREFLEDGVARGAVEVGVGGGLVPSSERLTVEVGRTRVAVADRSGVLVEEMLSRRLDP